MNQNHILLYDGLINKMIRYISQKQVDLHPRKKQYSYSQSKKQQSSLSLPEIPENVENSSLAMRQLKKINDHRQMLKGRLSVLQIQQQKNDYKAWLNHQKYKFHQNTRDQMEKQKEQKQKYLRKMLQKMHQAQQQARLQRVTHENNLKKAQEDLLNSKANSYKMTKQQRQQIQRSISSQRQQQIGKKTKKKQSVKEYQKAQKQNLLQFMHQKRNSFKQNDLMQVSRISKHQQQKLGQIQQLAKLQSVMLQRQARSKISSEQSQNKLRQLLSNKKTVSTSHTQKLPSINADTSQKKNATETDILII